MACGKSQLLMWAPDLRHLWPRGYRRGIAISAALARIAGAVLGCHDWWWVSACGWVVRSGRVGRGDARFCAVCTDLL